MLCPDKDGGKSRVSAVTSQDIPGHFIGKMIRDMPVLCWERVRFAGDRVAAVAADIPELETVLVRSSGGLRSYGAKAIGEFANNSPPAAIANAVADAVGVRLFELPITAEKIYHALIARRSP